MEECYLEGDNIIYYRKNKFTKKPTIVFIHGLSGSSSAWLPYERILESEFNILCPDLRGHGKSFRPHKLKDYSISAFSDDIYRIMKKERINDFIIVSHSFGNIVALEFLRKHQNIVKALILISPDPAPAKRKAANFLVPLQNILYLIDYLPLIKKSGKHVDYQKYLGTGDWNIRRYFTDIKNTGIRSYLFSMTHAYKFNFENFLTKIRLPTLIIHGDKDTIFPIESGIKASKAIKNSKFVVFEGSNHIIVLNDFDRLYKEIYKFLKGLR